jgi:hypothetical protein
LLLQRSAFHRFADFTSYNYKASAMLTYLAAWIAAFKASRLVCSALFLMRLIVSSIRSDLGARFLII